MNKLIMAVLLVFSPIVGASGIFGGDDTTINNHNTPVAIGNGGAGGQGGNGGIGIGKGGNADSRSAALAAASAKAHAASVAKQQQSLSSKNTLINGNLAKSNNEGVTTSNETNLSINEEAQDRNPVSSAIAPNLVTGGIDTCLGSSSVGAQGVGFGISFGTTTEEEHCQMLKASAQISMLGETIKASFPKYDIGKAIVARQCQDKKMAITYASVGINCNKVLGNETPAVGGGEGEIPYLVDVDDDSYPSGFKY